VCSSALVLCAGRDEGELAHWVAAIGRDVAELPDHGAAGTPAEVVDVPGGYAEAGASRAYLHGSTWPTWPTWPTSPTRPTWTAWTRPASRWRRGSGDRGGRAGGST